MTNGIDAYIIPAVDEHQVGSNICFILSNQNGLAGCMVLVNTL